MTITIRDHKGGMYRLSDKEGKTSIQSIGRYNFSGIITTVKSPIRMGEKFSIEYRKNGLYGDPDSSASIFESGIITDISVIC